jgi:hypothetical protein
LVSEQNGTITVRSIGVGKNKTEALNNAEQSVFYTILYRGMPGATEKNALIDIPESEAEKKFSNYLDAFFDNRYQTFVTTVVQNGDVMKEKHGKKSISIDVTINYTALKKDLEDNQVIRKFGF